MLPARVFRALSSISSSLERGRQVAGEGWARLGAQRASVARNGNKGTVATCATARVDLHDKAVTE